MKYFIALIIGFIFLSNCGGSSNKEKVIHSYSASVIDGYIKKSDITIYESNNTIAKKLQSDDKGSFSYKTTSENLYVKTLGGIDTYYNEVHPSRLYGLLESGKVNVISPLSSIIYQYSTKNNIKNYSSLVKNLAFNLKIENNILTFDPIKNIKEDKSSLVIQKMITFDMTSRLVNRAINGQFEDYFYSTLYPKITSSQNLYFLYSDTFFITLGKTISYKNSLNQAITIHRLSLLAKPIEYLIQEMKHFKSATDKELQDNFKTAYILMYPLIENISSTSKIIDTVVLDGNKMDEYFNKISDIMKESNINNLVNGLKVIGGFRGILSKVQEANSPTRGITYLKPSYFSRLFLTTDLLLDASKIYNSLNQALVSGSPSGNKFKNDLIINTFASLSKSDNSLNYALVKTLQDKIDKEVSIKTDAEKKVLSNDIINGTTFFKSKIEAFNKKLTNYKNDAIKSSKISIENNKQINELSLSSNKKDLKLKEEKIKNIKNKYTIMNSLRNSSLSADLINYSKNYDLAKAQGKLIQYKIDILKLQMKQKDISIQISSVSDSALKSKLKAILLVVNKKTNKKTIEIEDYTKFQKDAQDIVDSLPEVLNNVQSNTYKTFVQDSQIDKKAFKVLGINKIILNKLRDKFQEKRNTIIKKIKNNEKIYTLAIKSLNAKLINEVSSIDANTRLLTNKAKEDLDKIRSSKKALEGLHILKEDLIDKIPVPIISISGFKSCYESVMTNKALFTLSATNRGKITLVSDLPVNMGFSSSSIMKTGGVLVIDSYSLIFKASNNDGNTSKTISFSVKSPCNPAPFDKPPQGIPSIPSIDAPKLSDDKNIANSP